LRVAAYSDLAGASPTPATTAAVQEAASALNERGCIVSQVSPPGLDRSLPITEAYWARVRSASLSQWLPSTRTRLSADEIEQSLFEWERFSRAMTSFMQNYDIVLSPVAARPAPLHDAWGTSEYVYTLPYSLTRQPVAVVPFGKSPEGLPIGIQIAAGNWR